MSAAASEASATNAKNDGPKTDVKSEPSTPNSNRGGGRGGPRGGGPGGPMFRGRGSGPRQSPFGNRGGPGGRGGFAGRGGPRGGGNNGPPQMRGSSMDRNAGGGDQRNEHHRGGPHGHHRGSGNFDRVLDKLAQIQGPTFDLPQLDMTEKKFSGRARIYIGNFTNDMTEDDLKSAVSAHGELGEMFFNREKNFAFVRMGSKFEAEKVKRELDGQMKHGRALKVRFSPHQAAVKVSNLGPWVSNELLHKAFSIFGEIERCVVFVDERGRSKGEGLVEFEKKPCALECVKRCSDGCFFLTASLRPVIAEIQEEAEDDDGMQEKMLPKRNQEYHAERETAPRFAAPGSFEFEYGSKWKALYDMKKQKMESLEREMKLEEDKLIAQMEFARYEHETESLRDQLRMREQQRDQQKMQWEEREREMSEMMKMETERRNREEQAMAQRMEQQEAAMRRRQEENSLFMQAQELNQMLDQQEAAMRGGGPGPNNDGPWNQRGFQDNFGPPGPGFGGPQGPPHHHHGGPGGPPGPWRGGRGGGGHHGGGPWGGDRGGHQNKRRRF